jgi:hypothetical protein
LVAVAGTFLGFSLRSALASLRRETAAPPQPSQTPEVEDTDNVATSSRLLDLLAKVLGLFAALTGLVYCLGGVLLVARLVNEQLPWQPVISQLPRDLLLSAGATPILLAALVGLTYLAFRFFEIKSRAYPKQDPSLLRRAGWFLGAWAMLSIPVGVVSVYNAFYALPQHFEWSSFGASTGVLALVALIAVRTRNSLAKAFSGREVWRLQRSRFVVALAYTMLATPSMAAAVALTPLSDVKICTTGDFEEWGLLIGPTGDSIAIGERAGDKRVALIPTSQIEEVFIGQLAETANCDVDDARLAIIMQSNARIIQSSVRQIASVGDPGQLRGVDLVESGAFIVDRCRTAVLAALDITDAAEDLEVPDTTLRELSNHVLLKSLPAAERALTASREGAGEVDLVTLLVALRGDTRRLARLAKPVASNAVAVAAARQPA